MAFEMRRYGWLANVAMATVVRRLTYIALTAVLAYFTIAKAEAAVIQHASREAAYNAAAAQYGQFGPKCQAIIGPNYTVKNMRVSYNPSPEHFAQGDCWNSQYQTTVNADDVHRWPPLNGGCPAGTTWNEVTNTCYVAPTPDDCKARNADSKKPNVIQFTGTACINGCSYGPTKPGFTRVINGVTYRSGEMGYTGATCSLPAPTPPPEPEKPAEPKCIPIDGQTVCIQPEDNKLCYTGGSVTNMVCWSPGETGEKTDGPLKHVVAPGTNPGTPSPPLPGDTQSPTGTPTTITTTGPNGTHTTTHTTTTTGSGNNAGPRDAGQPTGTKGGPDGKDESKGTAAGGDSCKVPPTCSGDAVLCAINLNAWRTGCRGDKNGDGQPDWTEGTGPAPPGDGDDETDVGEIGVNTGMLDTENIFGTGSCPILTVTIRGVMTSSDSIPQWCNIVLVMRGVVLLMGAFAAIKILLGA